MKKLLFIIPALALVLAACSSVKKITRVSTSLHAQEYNSIASRYMEKPTSVEIRTSGDGKESLVVEMKTYAIPSAYSGTKLSHDSAELLKRSRIVFAKDLVNNYVSAIDKFLEWSSLASERKDAFSKDISRVPETGRSLLKFGFHSGSDQSHYLVIVVYSLGIPLDDQAQYYDVAGAKELKRLLQAFASGSIQQTDIGSVYK